MELRTFKGEAMEAVAPLMPAPSSRNGDDLRDLVEAARRLYRQHLLDDRAADTVRATLRERFEAIAHAVRDLSAPRWARTQETYTRTNPKRVYYLSMEFLLGRSLGNNLINLLLDPWEPRIAAEEDLDWIGLLEQEPDAGLGNGGLGRSARAVP